MSACGLQIISGHLNHVVKIWNFATRLHIFTLDCYTEAIVALAVSSDGNFLVSGDGTGCLFVWDLQKTEELSPAAVELHSHVPSPACDVKKPRLLYVLGNTGAMALTKGSTLILKDKEKEEKLLLVEQLQDSPFDSINNKLINKN